MRSPRSFFISVIVCVSLTLAVGCGDDDSTGENNNNPGDAGADAAPDAAAGERLELIILDGTDPDVPDASALRLEGVMVAFDLPGGERVERTTDANGHVVVYGVDWSLGRLSMTAYLEGYAMVSFVDLEASSLDPSSPWVHLVDDTISLYLMQLSPPDPAEITVTGTATGMEDPIHEYMVNAIHTDVTTQWTGLGSNSFSIVAPANTPFTLLGVENTPIGNLPSGQGNDIEIHRAMELNVAATAGPTLAVELDFAADQIPLYTADASIVLPTRADSPLRDGMPYLLVGSAGGMYSVGWGTPVDISADGDRFEGTVTWVEPSLATEPFAFYVVYVQSMLARSVALEPGYPTGTPLDSPIYDLPRWISPGDPAVPYPLHDPIEWELFDDWEVVLLSVSRSGIVVWRVRAPANATTLTVPQPPSTVDVNSFLGTSFQGQLTGGMIEPGADRFDRYVESPVIRLSRE